jgi:hypothetical protein
MEERWTWRERGELVWGHWRVQDWFFPSLSKNSLFILFLLLTLSVRPHMWETSNREACVRQCLVESMMESEYWMGMDQPAKGTILPGARTEKGEVKEVEEKGEV